MPCPLWSHHHWGNFLGWAMCHMAAITLLGQPMANAWWSPLNGGPALDWEILLTLSTIKMGFTYASIVPLICKFLRSIHARLDLASLFGRVYSLGIHSLFLWLNYPMNIRIHNGQTPNGTLSPLLRSNCVYGSYYEYHETSFPSIFCWNLQEGKDETMSVIRLSQDV